MEEEAEASGERRQKSHEWVGEGSHRVMRPQQEQPDPEKQQEWGDNNNEMALALQALLQDGSSLSRAASYHHSSF